MYFVRLTAFLFAFVLFSQPILAIPDPIPQKGDWSDVKNLAPGTEIIIETTANASKKGKLTAASDTSVSIDTKKGVVSVGKSEVKAIVVLTADKWSRGKSAAIMGGIGAGIGFGVAVALLGATGGSDSGNEIVAAFTVIGGGAGAALGAAFGRGKKHNRIYEVK